MKLPIVKIGRPVLRTRCAAVNEKIRSDAAFRRFFDSMVQTMRKAEGVGLAANQVGVNLRAIVLESRADRRYPDSPRFPLQAYVNPKIIKASKRKVLDWEGCLSIPGYRGVVPRHESITVEVTTLDGKTIRRKVSGFEARVFQHEIDHINGFFYADRMPNLKTWMHEEEVARRLSEAEKAAK